MKLLKYPFAAVCLLLCAATLSPENIATLQPPPAVNAKLKSMYPNALNVQWEMEKENYEAEFLNGDKEIEILFSPDGEVIEISLQPKKKA